MCKGSDQKPKWEIYGQADRNGRTRDYLSLYVDYTIVGFKFQVPSSMTVAKLRALLRRVYKKTAGSAPLDLFLLGQESKTEVRLDNDLRELSFYSVCEGDTLLVRWSAATETDL